MPWDKSKYPKNWKAIRAGILKRAENKCERCGILNHAIGYRERNGDFVQLADCKANCGMNVEQAQLDGHKIVQIVLTIAHVGETKHDKMDCRPEVLEALCQRCHLIEDIDEHTVNSAATRARKRQEEHEAAGQLELLEC